ncbi:cell division protein FtsA [Microbacterium sp. NPDC058345]|uniref:cell division protein FtsA n=1 Tax=Microbacterium sp. NPDC058345 TaxID=3346455 RepID=UPI0036605B3A
MTEARLDELLREIQRRIRAEDAHRRRRNRLAVTLGGAVACVAVTGGALAVAQATSTEKSVSLCHQEASAQSPAAEVGAAPIDGTVAALPDMAARVAFAEAQCEAVWRIGLLESDSTPAGTSPPLFTCLLADGRLGVFPAEESRGCDAIGLRRP